MSAENGAAVRSDAVKRLPSSIDLQVRKAREIIGGNGSLSADFVEQKPGQLPRLPVARFASIWGFDSKGEFLRGLFLRDGKIIEVVLKGELGPNEKQKVAEKLGFEGEYSEPLSEEELRSMPLKYKTPVMLGKVFYP